MRYVAIRHAAVCLGQILARPRSRIRHPTPTALRGSHTPCGALVTKGPIGWEWLELVRRMGSYGIDGLVPPDSASDVTGVGYM